MLPLHSQEKGLLDMTLWGSSSDLNKWHANLVISLVNVYKFPSSRLGSIASFGSGEGTNSSRINNGGNNYLLC